LVKRVHTSCSMNFFNALVRFLDFHSLFDAFLFSPGTEIISVLQVFFYRKRLVRSYNSFK
jgi:hypothetical protein